jgi:hypothetical protein
VDIPKDIEPFYYVTFILGSLVCCKVCNREPEYSSAHPKYCDENYYDQAVAMKEAGWIVNGLDALCPECRKRQ